jgi:hypothetical protein
MRRSRSPPIKKQSYPGEKHALIKPWIFEFMQAPDPSDGAALPGSVTAVFNEGFAFWLEAERLGFEGIFFS